MIHLSKSSEPTPRSQTLHQRRADSPVARPTQPTLSDEVRGRIEVHRQRSAASRAGEPSCQPLRDSATAPKTTDTSRREGQRSPDPVTRISSAPPTIPKTSETPPHQAVDRGAPSVRQHLWGCRSGVNGHREKSSASDHAKITAVRQPRRERTGGGPCIASIWTCWARTSVQLAALRASKSRVAHDARVW